MGNTHTGKAMSVYWIGPLYDSFHRLYNEMRKVVRSREKEIHGITNTQELNGAVMLLSSNLVLIQHENIPDRKVHGANMGPTWVLSAPDGPHVFIVYVKLPQMSRCHENACTLYALELAEIN